VDAERLIFAKHIPSWAGLPAGAREKLARNRLDSPRFDTPRFVKDLESGYAQMLDRFRSGLPPDHMNVIGV
jgi:hypothetical protein